MSDNNFDDGANVRTVATDPVRMVTTSNAEALRYGRRQWVTNPNKPGERKLLRGPAHAHEDVEAQAFHPRAKTWYEPVVKIDGNLVNFAMTSSSSDIPTGNRHEPSAMWNLNDAWLLAGGAIRTRACFDKQIARGQLNANYVLRELVDAPPCDPSCCTDPNDEGYLLWDGTPKCPKTRKERESRLGREAERQNEMLAKHERDAMSHDLAVAKKANEHSAQTLGPAIAQGMAALVPALASAMREALEAEAPKKSKK